VELVEEAGGRGRRNLRKNLRKAGELNEKTTKSLPSLSPFHVLRRTEGSKLEEVPAFVTDR
jgi:hypothetical protein